MPTAQEFAASSSESESDSGANGEEAPPAAAGPPPKKGKKRPAATKLSGPPAKRKKTTKAPEAEPAEGKGKKKKAAGGRPVGQPDVALPGPTTDKWESLNVGENSRKAIASLGFEKMTEIQAKSIPPGLAGKDIIGAAKTGSGKTLAFVIPAIELLCRTEFKPRNGTGVLCISPVRELAIQIYGVVRQMMEGFHTQSYGIVIGGANRDSEARKLQKGVNFLVATPGRLLDHLSSTRAFNVKSLLLLIIDEADRILEIGFEEEIKKILKKLPNDRQTMLFSATQTKKTKDLIKLSFRSKPIMVDVMDKSATSTRAGLQQGYVCLEQDKKFLLLFSFLKRNKKKKCIVFMSTCKAVRFFSELLNYIDLPVLELHGQLKQKKRTATFFEFVNLKHGALVCTNVAARGLDIPAVDWIIQYDPADDPKEYIHRVGRTARGIDGRGKALMFLTPKEVTYLKHLRRYKVKMSEYEFPNKKIANVQAQLEDLISKTYHLHRLAREAYRSFLQGYAQQNPKIFNVHSLDLNKVAKSFGFVVPPSVDLQISHRAKKHHKKKGQKKNFGKFSEKNPYGE